MTEYPPGFEFSDGYAQKQQRDPRSLAEDASVCADSFSEFLYRFWIENEIFFRAGSGLTDGQRRYGEYFRDRMRGTYDSEARDRPGNSRSSARTCVAATAAGRIGSQSVKKR